MITEFLQDQAAQYVSGALTEQEREKFELVLQFEPELCVFVTGLAEISVAVTLATQVETEPGPSANLKGRILGMIEGRSQHKANVGIVMAGPDGLVKWVNPAFTEMCGYSAEELRGKKPGLLLQGPKTDREAAARMGRAVHECRPCVETILNYHKNGAPYWVEIAITPIMDEENEPLFLVAQERELTELAIP